MLAFIAYFAVKLFTAESAKSAKQKGEVSNLLNPLRLLFYSVRRPKFYPETNNPKIVKRVPMADISVKRSFKKTAAAITVITGIT